MQKIKATSFHSKLIILTISFFFCSIPLLKASTEIDSLSTLLPTLENNIHRVEVLNELAYLYRYEDRGIAVKYANEACSLSQELDYDKGLGDCKFRLGTISRFDGNLSQAIQYYQEGTDVREKLNNIPAIVSGYNNIGICLFKQNKFSEAIVNYKKGLNRLKEEKLLPIKGFLYNNLSETYTELDKYEMAKIYLDSSIQVWENLGDNQRLAGSLQGQGHLYLELRTIEKALEKLNESLALFEESKNVTGQASVYISIGNVYFKTGEYNLAFKYYEKADALSSHLNEEDLAVLYLNFGVIFKEKKQFKKALYLYKKSLSFYTKLEANRDIAHLNYELGNLHQIQFNYTLAKKYYLKCISQIDNNLDPYIKAQTMLHLSEVYSKLKNTELTIYYAQQYNNIRDSFHLNKINAVNNLLDLEEQKKKNTQLELQISETERKELWRKGINTLFILGSLLASFIFLFYNSQQKRQIAEQQMEIAEQQTEQAYLEIDDLLRNKELDIAYAQLDAKDATQKQIGQDLHDRLGMMLSTIKLYFTEFSQELKGIKKETSQNENKTFELLDEAVKEVRRIAQDMQSGVLQKFGLASAVKDLANTIENSNQLKVEINAHGLKDRIPNQMEVKIYKIIQELIGNVLKHAKANKLTIYLHRQNGLFNLIVEDDGIGFQPDKVADKGGMGLKNITFRVTELNGTCHFDSNENKGTSVIIDIPINQS